MIVGGFLRVLRFPPPMTEILLKVALNTIKQQQQQHQKKDMPKTSVVINTDCIGSCKSNYHMIMATTAPPSFEK
jgi:hypothetical protein